jgi:UDP-N-acetylmuramate--alanine ligase
MDKLKNKTVVANKIGLHRITNVHFVGIGGVGMGGIAEVLINLGFKVSGSDIGRNALVERLEGLGANVTLGHHKDNVKKADVVVVSTAIDKTNPEIVEAKENRIPIIRRAEMLAELMRFRLGIAIAGTHGKTTTTSLVACILIEAGFDPTYVIGGRLNSSASNAKLGTGDYLVAEADESDASFLYLQPLISVVTNIDADHLQTYQGSFAKLQETFVEFLHHLPFYGHAILCIDDPHVEEIISKISKPIITYGTKENADVRATNIKTFDGKSSFDVILEDGQIIENIELALPGVHNVLNALAAIVIAVELKADIGAIKTALKEFEGIARRFNVANNIKVQNGKITVVDDYGHHPTEMAATIQAAKECWPERRLVVVFQPHRYTRTEDCFDDLANVLSETEKLIVSDVYGAGEKLIEGADGRSLVKAIRQRGKVDPIFMEDINELEDLYQSVCVDGDVMLLLGAGSIGAVAQRIMS